MILLVLNAPYPFTTINNIMSNLEQWLQSTDLHYLIAHYSDLETLRQEKAANILLATWFSCKMTSNKEQAQKLRTVDVSLPR